MQEVPASLPCLAYIVLKRLGILRSPECLASSIIDAALALPEVQQNHCLISVAHFLHSIDLQLMDIQFSILLFPPFTVCNSSKVKF
ncbi:hypothetical protein TanjilG_08674 [Lupinus angustifolius]|uniref:Uncharacterized protein n=1 Tax=Lupinus angustifolius TaxID=3871 RepID=A0A4P1QX76_LUPAN|nr:hypothetical protein TanjilG_08674 [Lupinus angustifolius]